MLTTAPRELVEAELREHLVPDEDGRWRYRYCQSAVVAAYGEMTREQPAFTRVRIPTLLVLGETSYLPYDALLDDHTAALGDLLEVVRIPPGTRCCGMRSRRPRARSSAFSAENAGRSRSDARRPIDSLWKLALSSAITSPRAGSSPWRNGSADTAR